MIPELIVIAVLIGLALKGNIARLADAPIKHFWIVYVVAAAYVSAGLLNHLTRYSMHMWVFPAVAFIGIVGPICFAVVNGRIPGAKLMVLGLALDLVASVANGGLSMPVSGKAVVTVWGPKSLKHMAGQSYIHHALMTPGTRLGFLCDIIPAKAPPFLLSSIYSIGDVILSVGIGIAVVAIMRMPLKGQGAGEV